MNSALLKKNMMHVADGPGFVLRGRASRRCLAQVVLEYAVLIAIVAAAFITMSLYIKRAVQGSITRIESKAILSKAVGEPTYPMPPNW